MSTLKKHLSIRGMWGKFRFFKKVIFEQRFVFFVLFCFVFVFLGPYLRHMEVPRLGV